jgi:beclin 1
MFFARPYSGAPHFLSSLKELADFVSSKNPQFSFPYAIEYDKVGGFSVNYTNGNEEQWTRALKFLLTNLKYLVLWSAGHVPLQL